MTLQLEEAIGRLARQDALMVLEAVNGTLEALRRDAHEIGGSAEVEAVVSRIETYLGHLEEQRRRLNGARA